MLKAVIFDVDGTLMDTVRHHVRAWVEALREANVDVKEGDVHELIGRSGHGLLNRLLTGDERERLAERVNMAAGRIFRARRDEIQVFPGVVELIRRVHEAGLRVALASNSPREELELYQRRAKLDGTIEVEICREDVEHGKPSPEAFERALRGLCLRPDEVLVVGDTPADIEAAQRAGMRAIGLDSGGFWARDLERAGAIAVYPSAKVLLEQFAESPLSQGSGKLA